MDKKVCLTMISNVTFVAQWWRYKTRHQQDVPLVVTQWLESGHHQPLSLMALASIVREDDNAKV